MFSVVVVVGFAQVKRASTTQPKSAPTSLVMLPSGVKLEMVILPPGTFLMGSATSVRVNGGGNLTIGSGPDMDEDQHKVTLTKGFQ
jgi:formylglycine-generating enzyme required for sulfatase activity